MNNRKGITLDSNRRKDESNPGCWAKFKTLFQDRGFDLEYEYNSTASLNISSDTPSDMVLRSSRGNRSNEMVQTPESYNEEPSREINFYEQFTTLEDDKKDYDLWRKSSTIHHRVSVRPSIFLTNIDEETSEVDEMEFLDVSTYAVFNILEYFR